MGAEAQPIVPRWEWRVFGEPAAAARLAGLPPERVQESDETYLLSSAAGTTAKIRDGLLDVKRLERVDPSGLEQWLPVTKAPFPVAADDVAAALGLDPASLARAEYSLDELLDEVVRPDPGLLAVEVHKRRERHTLGGCAAERTEVRAGGAATWTVAVESEDPALVLAVVRELGLGPNTSFPRGLAALVGFGARRFAVLDVGTNSVKFTLGERRADGTWRTLDDRAEVTRLGEGLDEAGRLGEVPMERTLATIAAMADEARREGAEATAAVGTAGLRIAANSAEFVDAARERAGVDIEVIPGDEEARLAYLAATAGLAAGEGSLAVFDTGGGSSQFTFGRARADRGAVQRERRRGPFHRALRPRRGGLRGRARGRTRRDRGRPRPPRRPTGAGRARRPRRRGHEPRGGEARARDVRPRRRPGHGARPRRGRPPARALPHPPGRGAARDRRPPAGPRRGDPRRRLHRADRARRARPRLARRQRPRSPARPARRAVRVVDFAPRMATEPKRLTALSSDELTELLALAAGADTVELKVTLPQARPAVAALGIDPLDAQIRQVFFFDTPELALNAAGVVVRARRVQGRGGDTVVKLRPVVPEELPDDLRRSGSVGVEVDAMPGGYVCSASMKGKAANEEIRDAVGGELRLRKLFSKEQRAFYAAHAPEGIDLDSLEVLGPTFVLKLALVPPGYDRRLVAELWLLPDGTSVFELSTKCLPAEAFQVAIETRAFLEGLGLDLAPDPHTKTKTALEFHTAALAAG
jgi:hypothetical protein